MLFRKRNNHQIQHSLCAAETNAVFLYDEWGLEDEIAVHLDKARDAAERSGVSDAFLRVDNLSVYYALKNGEYDKADALLDSMQVRMPDRSQSSFYHEFYDNYSCILAISETKGDSILYPSFLSRLRKVCPTVTRSEELLAMLVRLHLSSDEIAFALGNNRASVNTSRFRFRKKLGLEKEVSLEEYIDSL